MAGLNQINFMTLMIATFFLAVYCVANLAVILDFSLLFLALPVSIYCLGCPRIAPCGSCVLGLLLGLMNAEQGLNAAYPESENPQRVIGYVVSLPEVQNGINRFQFRILEVQGDNSEWQGLVKVSWYEPPEEIVPGDRFNFVLKLSRPHTSINPGLFDYEGWLFARKIRATGYVRQTAAFSRLGSDWWRVPHHYVRFRMRAVLQKQLTSSAVGGLLVALAIGDTAQIDKTAWRHLSRTGTNHLLIISGLHVGLVAAMIFKALGLLWFRDRTAAAITIAMTTAYALLAGFGLPVQRAWIMSTVVLVALAIRRPVRLSTLFCLSLLGVLMFQPLAVINVGFWLSFGAVFVLLYAFSGRHEVTKNRFGIGLAALKTQWVVFVAMLPVLLYLINQVSLASFLVNTIAIPVVGFLVIPCLLLTVVIAPFSTVLAGGPLALAEWNLSRLWQLIVWFSDANLLYHGVNQGLIVALIGFCGVLVMLAPRGLLPRWVGLLCLLPLLNKSQSLSENRLQLTFIDVGQGLAVIIRTRSATVLYDTGPAFGDRFDAGESIITPLLHRAGISYLDMLIVSHGDTDHAGGMQSIIRNFAPRTIIAPTEPYQGCTEPVVSRFDAFQFEVFAVDAKLAATNSNNRSCLLLVSIAGRGILMTGDIETEGETALLTREMPVLDVISIPHHGSRTSSTPGFINHTHPQLGIVSAGYDNRFNHPDPEVMARYRRRHVRTLLTASAGAITITFSEKGVETVSRARVTGQRFWHW